MRFTSSRLAFAAVALCAVALPACGDRGGGFDTDVVSGDARVDVTRPQDSAGDAGHDASPIGEAGAPCTDSTACDDGNFCNGAEQCVAGFCRAGQNPCNDHAECTIDTCVASNHTCRHEANDTMCGDQLACNGVEHCAPTDPGADPVTGCQPVVPDNVPDCNDNNDCTIDSCVEPAGCTHGSRDLDNDGHVEQACTVNGLPGGAPGDDCNDTDPTVHPGATEICDDNKDNDCDGQVDFQDANANCVATNDTCANARVISASGTFWTSTNGLHNDLTLSCNAGTAADSVWTFTLTETRDVRASLATTASGAAVAITSDCGTGTELACAKTVTAGGTSSAPQVLVRSLPAGTYFIVVENAASAPFRLSVQFSTPTTPPPGDVCPPTSDALDLASGTAQTAMLGTFGDDYTLSCNTGLPRNDAVFRLSVADVSDVDLTVTSAGGTNYVSLRNGPCGTGTQTRCISGASVTTALRNLAAGDYFVFVENSQNQPVTASAAVHSPGDRSPGDNCATVADVTLPATLPGMGTSTVSWAPLLTGSDYGTTCGSNGMPDGWKDAVFHYALPVQSDVTLTITPSAGWTPRYYWQLANACGGASPIGACTTSTAQSVTHYAGQPAGDYYLVIETNSTPPTGASFQVQVSAIDTASRPAYESCPGAPIALSGTGTTLTGTTTINASMPALDNFAQSGTSCGSAGFANGWTDVMFSYTLPAPSDVTVSFASDPLRAWFYEFQTTCGSSATRLRPSSPTGVSDCNVHTTGGIGTGAANTYTFVNQPAGTYYLVAETSAPDPGSVKIDVSAVTH